MDDAKMSIRRGGMRIRMIPGWEGGRTLPAKSLSWVIKILFFDNCQRSDFTVRNPLGRNLDMVTHLFHNGNQSVVDVFVKQKVHRP